MARKLLVLVFIFFIGNYITLTAQTRNYVTGGAATPDESVTSHTPAPYDGTETFTAGSLINTADWNIFIGSGSGAAVMTSSHNVFIGPMAGALHDYGSGTSHNYGDNVVIGAFAGDQMTSAFDNVFIGKFAARTATGSDNVVLGTEAGLSLTSGNDNVIIGEEAGESITTAADNVIIGEDAGKNLTTGSDNCFIGSRAGLSNTTARGNTFVGGEAYSFTPDNLGNGEDYDFSLTYYSVGERNTTGEANTFIGSGAGADNEEGFANTFLGYGSGAHNEFGDGNTFLGYGAGSQNNRFSRSDEADRNTYVGAMAGGANREGSDNTGMGWSADFQGDDRSRTTFIGANSQVGNNDVIMMGYNGLNNAEFAISIGQNHEVRGTGAVGLGNAVTIGYGANNAVGLGNEANISRSSSIGIGHAVDVDNTQAVAIGAGSVVQNDGAIVIGYGARSNDAIDNDRGDPDATNNIAIGYNATVSGNNAIAIGNEATASEANTMILGGATNPVRVGVGTDAPNAYAALDLTSSNKGLFIPRLTTAQRTDLVPDFPEYPSSRGIRETEDGMMVYDTDEKSLYTWNGTEWLAASSDNLGNHTATTMLNMGENVIRFDPGEDNGIEFNGRSTYKISYGYSDNYHYGPVTRASIKTSMSTNTASGWTWGTPTGTPVAAISTEGKMQIANSLNIAGSYEFPIVDGSADQVLVTDGSGGLTWSTQIDNQELSLATNVLSISGGTETVDLSGYLDNTDAQAISLATNTLSITGNASTVDLSGYLDNTDNQDLSLSSNTLSLTNDATSVDLSGYLDNTDAQAISLATNTLSITGNASTVDLSGYLDNTDSQNLTSANLTGTNLTIEIENGSSVTVDLAPVVATLETSLFDAQSEIAELEDTNIAQQAEIDEQQSQINDLISRIDALESCACSNSGDINKGDTPILYQNIPNPFNGTSSIKYYLPSGITNASVVFSNSVGQLVSTVTIKDSGDGELNINSDGLASGTYFYTLYIGSRKIDSKKMVIE